MLAGSLDGRINAALAAAGVGRAAWPAAGEAPANCDVMAEARSPGSRAVICCWIAAIAGWAREAPADALPSDPEPDEPNVIAGIAPTVEGCTDTLPAGAPANWDVMAEARLLGSNAVICCWMALIVGWANDDMGVDAALEAIERTPLKCCRWLMKLSSGIGRQNTFCQTPLFQMMEP